MERTSRFFTHDYLVQIVRTHFETELPKIVPDLPNTPISIRDCLLSALALFTFKAPSLLQFEKQSRSDETLQLNIKNLFHLQSVVNDTSMREKLDPIPYSIARKPFKLLFALLQRQHILDPFCFFKGHYLISLDGTGYFSSPSVHCENCCVKEHKNGEKTYYHQMLSAALVHPDQKIVFPLCPEPIMKTDGTKKNDCERNAASRWIQDFRREHPHLKTILVADGLSSNGPFIRTLQDHNLRFILVAKETDHTFLRDWIAQAEDSDAPRWTVQDGKITKTYQYMRDVPLNEKNFDLKVNVIRYDELHPSGRKIKWMWVTDLEVNPETVPHLVKGGRARWKIENETFNTLKNQGYHFEHNYGHGTQNLSTLFAFLMMLVFLIDQILQGTNKVFQRALAKMGRKTSFFEFMRSALHIFLLPSLESLYATILSPPRVAVSPL